MRQLLSVWVLLQLISSSPLHASEWWAWSSLEYYNQPPWTASVFLGNRADTDDGSYIQIVSPRLKYAAQPWLDLGLGASALSIESTTTHIRYEQFRPEFEFDPHFDLSEQLRLESRNRLELRWNDGAIAATNRARHRLQLAWTLPQPLGPLTRLFASNEWLLDLHQNQWTENRTVPLGLTFKLTDRSHLDLFFMIVSNRLKAEWHNESILGTYLRLRF